MCQEGEPARSWWEPALRPQADEGLGWVGPGPSGAPKSTQDSKIPARKASMHPSHPELPLHPWRDQEQSRKLEAPALPPVQGSWLGGQDSPHPTAGDRA